ncbi:MAG: type I glutamate--ammonia ligase [Proteobacteria bacterium]|nr:type I glutamate--ammonia ligase [Pseudomonadota bacterium]
MNAQEVLALIKEQEIQFVDLRFCNTFGNEHQVTFPISAVDEILFAEGKMFDGSSVGGWRRIESSDMVLMPDPDSAFIDPFPAHPTIVIRCDVLNPATMQPYNRDPRSVAKRAEAYLQASGIADKAFFGPELEFFLFDGVRWQTNIQKMAYEIDSREGAWGSYTNIENNTGHTTPEKGGYFTVPPVDTLKDVRSSMSLVLENMGMPVEVHHQEVATAGQCEIGTKYSTLTKKADDLLTMKYVVQNVAHEYGYTATFMPKPLVDDNGSGMHVHLSLMQDGVNSFTGDKYGGLSQQALYYIGGIIKHAQAINAFANASTNSYKRLVPGFEAPVMLAYSAKNRSASIRIPFVPNPKGRRVEVRFGDAAGNPYLMFTAMMMAGLDGIKNKIDPGPAMDMDLYELSAQEEAKIPKVCHSLDQALEALDQDREFLKAGNVMDDDMIDSFIKLKMEEVTRLRMTTHPVEFDMYYSL